MESSSIQLLRNKSYIDRKYYEHTSISLLGKKKKKKKEKKKKKLTQEKKRKKEEAKEGVHSCCHFQKMCCRCSFPILL